MSDALLRVIAIYIIACLKIQVMLLPLSQVRRSPNQINQATLTFPRFGIM